MNETAGGIHRPPHQSIARPSADAKRPNFGRSYIPLQRADMDRDALAIQGALLSMQNHRRNRDLAKDLGLSICLIALCLFSLTLPWGGA